MSMLRKLVAAFVECITYDDQIDLGSRLHASVDMYAKPNPGMFKPGQMWLAFPLISDPADDPAIQELDEKISAGNPGISDDEIVEESDGQWWAENKRVAAIFVLWYVSEQQDHLRGFLVINNFRDADVEQQSIVDLADEGDVKLPDGPIDPSFVALWRGDVNLSPKHLRTYLGDVSEAKLREILDKHVPVITGKQTPPAQNPELQPYRDVMWEATACYDAEVLDKVLQD